MHRRLWLNDPDCLMLRARETQLTDGERQALAWTIAGSGGMLLISDDMSLLSEESAKLLQAVARVGAEVDAAAGAGEPPIAEDLLSAAPVRILSTRTARGAVHLVLNMGDSSESVRTADLTQGAPASIVELSGEIAAPETIELPPHSAALATTRR